MRFSTPRKWCGETYQIPMGNTTSIVPKTTSPKEVSPSVLLAPNPNGRKTMSSKSEDFIIQKVESFLSYNSFDHKRQYSVVDQGVWLDEYARQELLEYVYDETRINALAEIYIRSTHDAAVVATICDDVIDRSGKLLGLVRDAVRTKKEKL